MKIKDLIQEYKEQNAAGTLYNVQDNVIKTLRNLSNALWQGALENKNNAQWQIELEEVSDDLAAMFAFYEMALRKIDPKIAAVLSYYFATKVLKGNYTEKIKKDAYCIRATMVFQYNSLFQDYCSEIDNYPGILHDKGHFFNVLLLADYYSAEGNSMNNTIYCKMTPIAQKVAKFHSNFSKPQIILLGLDASNYLFNFICLILKNPSFPVSCL